MVLLFSSFSGSASPFGTFFFFFCLSVYTLLNLFEYVEKSLSENFIHFLSHFLKYMYLPFAYKSFLSFLKIIVKYIESVHVGRSGLAVAAFLF